MTDGLAALPAAILLATQPSTSAPAPSPPSPPLADDAAMPYDMAAGNETVVISYLRPNITIQMVDDFT